MTYYLIETKYVGPNRHDSNGNWIGDSRMMHICTQPWRTNQSHEERTEGWLGTTNDMRADARGEFESLNAARAAAHEAGFTRQYDGDDCDDGETVEQWISEEAARAQWDAGDWFINGLGREGTRIEYGITAETTDEELEAAIDRAEHEAAEENVEIHGTTELFEELRAELREELRA